MSDLKVKRPSFSLLDYGTDFYRLSCDAPLIYGKWLGITLSGNSLGFKSVNVIQPDFVHHNLYTLLIGAPAQTRKSTAQRLAHYKLSLKQNALPKEFSPESFIKAVSKNPDGMLFLGELNYLLEKAAHGGYMSGILSILNELYMCPEYYDRQLGTRAKDSLHIIIDNAHLSLVSTITPEQLLDTLKASMISSGMFPRYTVVFDKPHMKPRGRLPPDVSTLASYFKSGLELIDRLFEGGAFFLFTDDALKHYNKIEKELRAKYHSIPAFVERYLESIIKIADILLVSDAVGLELVESEIEWTEKGIYLTRLHNLTTLKDLTYLTSLSEAYPIPKAEEYVSPIKCIKAVKSVKLLSRVHVPPYYVEEAKKFIEPCLEYAKFINAEVMYEKKIRKVHRYLNELELPVWRGYLLQRTHLDRDSFQNGIETFKATNDIIEIRDGKTYYCKPTFFKEPYEKCDKCKIRDNCPVYKHPVARGMHG